MKPVVGSTNLVIIRCITQGLVPVHGVITIPITLVLSFLLTYYTIGLYSTLTAFGAVLLFIPLQLYAGKGVQICRLASYKLLN